MPLSPASFVPAPADAGQRSLPVLEAGGFRASVDAFALQAPPDGGAYQQWLWCVSLLGPQQAVKALWARLMKGELATLSLEALHRVYFCRLAPEGAKGWRFSTASLPRAGGYQGVLLPEIARYVSDREDFLLLARGAEEAPALHYRFLNRRLDLPLHPAWRAWLWDRALRMGEAMPLEAGGLVAYRCRPDAARLAGELGDALRRGQLPLVGANPPPAGTGQDRRH
jgi:hypothetical protein